MDIPIPCTRLSFRALRELERAIPLEATEGFKTEKPSSAKKTTPPADIRIPSTTTTGMMAVYCMARGRPAYTEYRVPGYIEYVIREGHLLDRTAYVPVVRIRAYGTPNEATMVDSKKNKHTHPPTPNQLINHSYLFPI